MDNKKQMKEAKELAKREKQSALPRAGLYLLFVMVVLTVIYVVDEITSNVNAAMQPYVLFDLFRLGWGPYAAGIAYGCSIGGLWSMSDTLILTMPAESSPSGMRSSVMGTISVMIGAGMFVGQVLFIVLQNFLPMDVLFLIICVPFMLISLILLAVKVRETKDADLDNITADTYR